MCSAGRQTLLILVEKAVVGEPSLLLKVYKVSSYFKDTWHNLDIVAYFKQWHLSFE